ncbi:hypothetical protein ES707_15877 [subsurface metagenome]
MANRKFISKAVIRLFLFCFVAVLLSEPVCGDWLKMDPPPDVDKKAHNDSNKPTCWLATAANMLAAAGYGTGTTVQARADSIYTQMVTLKTDPVSGLVPSGWTDEAVDFWLASSHNKQKTTNPYTSATVHGNKSPKTPWHHDPNYSGFLVVSDDGTQFLANELRRCQMVGVSISWPKYGTIVGTGGHAITGWGDANEPNLLTGNPDKLFVGDSDKDNGGDVQKYTYDDFKNPNPSGYGGRGWYINYSNNHPFIKHIVTLCPIDDANDANGPTKKLVGSYKVCNNSKFLLDDATDLHYVVSTGSKILSYLTTINWQTSNTANIQEASPRKSITVDWDLSDNNVPHDGCVTITTEFVVPYSTDANMAYTSTYFTFPVKGPTYIPFRCGMDTPQLGDPNMTEPNISGGYVIGSFKIFNEPDGGEENVIAEFRLCTEYKYFQNPESHIFSLEAVGEGNEPPYYVGDFHFGHSYGILTGNNLWAFDQWLTIDQEQPEMFEPGPPIEKVLDWVGFGLLPYPPGEDYIAPDEPEQCGDPGTVYEEADLNKDCYVNFKDFAIIGQAWLECTDPNNISCW